MNVAVLTGPALGKPSVELSIRLRGYGLGA